MKAFLYDSTGNKKDAKAPAFFDSVVREDVVAKAVESEKYLTAQPYGLAKEAGKRHSASGTISHKRHEWKGHYGKGIARVPRKTMWRRGTQFYWIGAEVSGARGGRRVHGPTIFKHYRKVNKSEQKLALQSALAATAQEAFLKQRYPTLKTINAGVQSVAELPQKTAQLVELMEKAFGTSRAVPQQKVTRAGIGKRRGRRFKVNAGALVMIASTEKIANYKHLDVRTPKTVTLQDLYPLGRFTLYTQKALEELQNAI